MTLPLLKTLKAGPPPPKVVLLPDAMFFTRALVVAADATNVAVAEQVELALETLSPFPPAQLYHGFYRPAGAERALVFAAYRRRFTSEQVAEWQNAELVLPAFAALLAAATTPNTTVVLPSAEGLTAIYHDGGAVPAKIDFRPLPPEATEEEQARLRDELFDAAPSHRRVVVGGPPVVEASNTDRVIAFRADGIEARLPREQAGALDVRDKGELAALRRARSRDLALWRTFLALAGLLLLLGLGELALIGAGFWQKTRIAQADAQRPVVEKIAAAQSLTTRINELSTKRLLPFEMLAIATAARPSDGVQFLRTSTTGLYGLNVEAQTTTPALVSAYQAALNSNEAVQRVEVRDQRTRDNVMTFTFVITFKPEMLKPATPTP